eukprot:1139530-Rhodomonas_salina.1
MGRKEEEGRARVRRKRKGDGPDVLTGHGLERLERGVGGLHAHRWRRHHLPAPISASHIASRAPTPTPRNQTSCPLSLCRDGGCLGWVPRAKARDGVGCYLADVDFEVHDLGSAEVETASAHAPKIRHRKTC